MNYMSWGKENLTTNEHMTFDPKEEKESNRAISTTDIVTTSQPTEESHQL